MINNRLTFIVDRIDQAITDGFYVKGAKYWGLARLEPRQGQTIPMAYKGFGQNDFLFDDTFPMSLYHRVLDVSEEEDSEASFGAKSLITETFSMALVVFGNQRKVNDTDEDINYKIADEIKSLIPNKLDQTDIRSIEARSSFISTTGQDLNRVSVYGVEMPDAEYNLKPETLLFAINYTIEIKYDSDCKTVSCDIEAAPKRATVIDNENVNSPILLKLGDSYTCKPATTGTITGATCAELNSDLSQSQRQQIQRINPIITGQTVSYRTGDSRARLSGRLVDFFTLDCNNSFGNLFRFTDQNGDHYTDTDSDGLPDTKNIPGAYPDDYFIDHSTGIAYSWGGPTSKNWNGQIDAALAHVNAGFSNFELPNIKELFSLTANNAALGVRYEPISSILSGSPGGFWSSNTVDSDTTQAKFLLIAADQNGGNVQPGFKTSVVHAFFARNHF